MTDINTWSGRCKLWSDCTNLTWGEKIVVESVFTALDSDKTGGSGFVNTTKGKVKAQINKLTEPEKERLITVLVKLHGKDYKQTKRVRTGISINVEDIQFIMKEVKGIKINILKD